MAILPVKSPCAITIISIGAPLVLIVFLDPGGCCRIFGIWNNSLLSDSFWKLVFGLPGWVPTRSSSLWPAFFPGMSLFAALVKSHIWPGRWPSSRATNISTTDTLEVNLLQRLVDWLLSGHSLCLRKWRLDLILLFAGSRFSPLWINKIVVFTRSLLYK